VRAIIIVIGHYSFIRDDACAVRVKRAKGRLSVESYTRNFGANRERAFRISGSSASRGSVDREEGAKDKRSGGVGANAEMISKRRRPEEGKGGSKSQSRSARLMLDNADAAYRRSIKEDGGEQRRDGSRSGATIEKENYCESYLGSTRIPSGADALNRIAPIN